MPLLYHTGALGDFLLAIPLLRGLRAEEPTVAQGSGGLDPAGRAEGRRPRSPRGWTLVVPEAHARLVSRLFPFERRGVPGTLGFSAISAADPDPAAVGALIERHGDLIGFAREADRLEAACRASAPASRCVFSEPFARTTASGEEIEETLARMISRIAGHAVPPPGPADFAIGAEELPPLGSGTDPLGALGGTPPDRVALVHVGAGGREKMAPSDLLERVAAGLRSRGMAVVWIRGPVEVERGVPAPGGLRLDAPDIVLLAHAAARASLWIGNDTGPTHLAAQLGVPTLALHGRPNPIWRPRGLRSRVVGGAGGFPSPAEVLDAADAALGRRLRPPTGPSAVCQLPADS